MPGPEAARFQAVQRVLWRVLFANALVAFSKLAVGLLTGMLAMVADGFHSMMDASSNLIGIAGTRLAARPPDAEHPYGHRRFETMATLAIGGLLLVAAWEILTTAVDRLVSGSRAEVTPVSFVVMIGTMILNVVVVSYETRQGRRLRSDVLLADASQTRVDFFISLSVIFGLAATALGYPWMDTVIALAIVALIGRAAYGILRKTTEILVDGAVLDPAQIQRVVANVPGVEDVVRVRSRGPTDAIHADIDVEVLPATTAEHARAIASEIQDRVKSAVEGVVEVQVQFTPHQAGPQSPTLVARAAADALGLSVHEVTEIFSSQGIILEMHVEVSPRLTLAEAHAKVSELEQRVCATLADVTRVITHIEPADGQMGALLYSGTAIALRERALAIARELYPDAHWHDITVRPVMGGYALTLDCCLPGTVSVQEAHAIAEHVETQIRAALAQVQRVTIHTEPFEPDHYIPGKAQPGQGHIAD